jgi:1,4-alpha-glucan branching enzyme
MSAKKTNPKRKPDAAPPATTHMTVHLEFHAPGAKDVCLAGSFNDWHPTASPMVDLGNGRWAKEIVLPPGRYEYRFVVDGQWQPDPNAKESVTNPFGSTNSVLTVVTP